MKHLFAIILLIFLSSCLRDQGNLDKEVLKLSDSLYIQNISHMQAYVDSLCEVQYKNRINVFIDSIITVRKLEVSKLHDNK